MYVSTKLNRGTGGA
uniref:Uncharacterized protein n=1 Tax=Anguilla anguilla TaxID=7936 RepID=A0A0E9Q8Q0_ANGAN